MTRTAYISTDAIDADFTSQVIGPLTVLFNDTSVAAATSWAWDLDGDSVVDSTVQNPAWVYTNTHR
jgi:PKD repeat protein